MLAVLIACTTFINRANRSIGKPQVCWAIRTATDLHCLRSIVFASFSRRRSMADVGDTLPDEDFEALNAEGDEEEDDDQPVEGYETEDEAPPEVRLPMLMGFNGCPPARRADDVQVDASMRSAFITSRSSCMCTYRPRRTIAPQLSTSLMLPNDCLRTCVQLNIDAHTPRGCPPSSITG